MLHLLHPALVHFSVAFLVFGGLTEAIACLCHHLRAARFGGALVLIGTASLVLTIATGYLAANTIEVPEQLGGLLWAHERNGWLVLAVFFASQFWKAWNRGELPDRQRPWYAALLLVAVGLVIYSSYLGARMVYEHGLGTETLMRSF